MIRIIAFLLVGTLAACGGGGGGGGGAGAQVFGIAQVSPPDGSEGFPLTGEILVSFTRAVDPASLDDDSLHVVAESGDRIRGDLEVAPLNPGIVRFRPREEYFPFAVHTIRVTPEVRDEDGNPLPQEAEFRFQTEMEGPVLPTQQQVRDLGPLLRQGRWFHRMTLLPSNRFLVAGGYRSDNAVTDTAENLDPAQETSALIAAGLLSARAAHVQLRLADGRVLLAGGESSDSPFVPLRTCEIFDPSTFTFVAAASMEHARSQAQGTLLPDGRVLVTGGQDTDGSGGVVFRDDAEIYDPAADDWETLPSTMSAGRSGHFAALTTSGDVAVVGGLSGLGSAELFDPATGAFSDPGSQPATPHFFGAGTVLPDGRVFVAGGVASRRASILDPTFGFLASLNEMIDERVFATATALPDGRVFVVGGTDFNTNPILVLDSLDVFFPVGSTGKLIRAVGVRLPEPTSHHAAGLDANGNLWLTGGLPSSTVNPGRRQVTVVLPD